MIAFVTGGTGFLGRRVVRALAEHGMTVRCLVRPGSQPDDLTAFLGDELWRRVEIVRGELTKVESYREALAGVDVVYHLAAGLSGSTAALFLGTVVPTRVFARACALAKVPRFVLVSSLGVYGAGHLRPGAVLDETCPIDPKPELRDPYSFSKIVQEQACWEIRGELGLPLVVVRPGVIFGPERGALSTRFGLTFAGRTWRIGGARQLPYVYVENCAMAIRQAGLAPGLEGEIVNVLDDDLPSVRALLRAHRSSGSKLKSVWLPQSSIGPLSSLYEAYHKYSRGQLPGVLSRYRADTFWKPLRFSNSKAKSRLGWQPHVPMAEALRRTIAHAASAPARG